MKELGKITYLALRHKKLVDISEALQISWLECCSGSTRRPVLLLKGLKLSFIVIHRVSLVMVFGRVFLECLQATPTRAPAAADSAHDGYRAHRR